MSEENQNSNLNPDQPLSKEEKLQQLQELGIAGTDEDSKILLSMSHAELDYLISFNTSKTKDLSQIEEHADNENTEENSQTVPRKKWDDEVIKRRTFEAENSNLKKQIRGIAESLVNLAK